MIEDLYPSLPKIELNRRGQPRPGRMRGATKQRGQNMALDRADAALIKGMLARGDKQSDIAAFFGTNGGRVAEIDTGQE